MPGTKYLPNWHLEAMAWRLQCVLDGDIKRLLITMPPRSLKSIFASVALPAFALGHDPSKRIVCVSYAEDLAAKHARDCRVIADYIGAHGAYDDAGIAGFSTHRA